VIRPFSQNTDLLGAASSDSSFLLIGVFFDKGADAVELAQLCIDGDFVFCFKDNRAGLHKLHVAIEFCQRCSCSKRSRNSPTELHLQCQDFIFVKPEVFFSILSMK
jgi:hypothetical protein